MKQTILYLIAIMAVFITGCGNTSDTPDYPQVDQKGFLSLQISHQVSESKTLQPDVEMAISTYDIYGIGPNSASFTIEDTSEEFISIGIETGSWAITVLAKNSSDDIIASGDATATINAGEVTNVTITVTPQDGTGSLMLSISWPDNILETPSIVSTLSIIGESPTGLTFTMATDNLSASYSDSSIDAGYYLLVVKLMNGDALVWETVEAVRIIAGEITEGNYALTASDINLGSLSLAIEDDLQNPIAITFAGDESSLVSGNDMTVIATTSETVDGYQWYTMGDPITGGNSDTITIGNSLESGTYRLYLVVTRDNIISSNGFQFTVTEEPVTPVDYAIFINELHYDNDGIDENEGFEIAGPAATDLIGYSVILYNGGGGLQYGTIDLTGNIIPDQQNGYGTVFFAASMQNGPDALALIAPDSTVIQFLSYEDVITAADGHAAGMTSENIGVEESDTNPLGYSLQLGGTGTLYSDFYWCVPDTSTYGAVNNEQTFGL